MGATGSVLSNGGRGSREYNSTGGGGAGSGGAIFLQAATINLATGATVQALGGLDSGHGGPGGDGRIRADAPLLELAGASATQSQFQNATNPTTGYFGGATPTVSVTTPANGGGSITVPYSVTDSQGNPVTVEVQVSKSGGAFETATAASGSEPLFGVPSSATGTLNAFTWSSATDLGAGTFNVKIQVRATGYATSAWVETGTFTVSN